MRWRILLLLFLARIGMGLQFQTMASVGDEVAVAFGLDYTDIGLFIGIFMMPGLFLAIPSGASGRYASDRALAVAGLLLLALGGIASATATNGLTIGIGRALAGTGFLFSNLFFTKMVAEWFEGREIATAMSVLVMSWPLGIAIGQVGHVWLAELFSWRLPFQVASAYCLLAALAVLSLYRPHAPTTAARSSTGAGLSSLEWKLVLCVGLSWAIFNAGYVIFLSFGPVVLEASGLRPLSAAGIVSTASWVMIVSVPLCGQFVDRFGRRDLVLVFCTMGAVLALALLFVPGGALPASLLFGLIGMAPAGLIMAMTGEALPPEKRAFGMGVFFSIYFAINMVMPPVAGMVFDVTGRFEGVILLAAALFALIVPITLAFRFIKSAAPRSTATKA